MVEVSYTSLRAVYPVLDSYSFPLVRSRVRCVCDCPGGAAHCPADLCGNTTNCHTHYSPSVPSTGCFLSWLQLSASLCCSIQVSATCHVSRVTCHACHDRSSRTTRRVTLTARCGWGTPTSRRGSGPR